MESSSQIDRISDKIEAFLIENYEGRVIRDLEIQDLFHARSQHKSKSCRFRYLLLALCGCMVMTILYFFLMIESSEENSLILDKFSFVTNELRNEEILQLNRLKYLNETAFTSAAHIFLQNLGLPDIRPDLDYTSFFDGLTENQQQVLKTEIKKSIETDDFVSASCIKLWKARQIQKVISFSLFVGRTGMYRNQDINGIFKNCQRAKEIYPEFSVRVYHNGMEQQMMENLHERCENIEFADVSKCGFTIASGMFWRFLVADDPSVKWYVVRDLDSQLTVREKAAVDEWIASERKFHVMRDHPLHNTPVMGGMWGGIYGAVPPPQLTNRIREYFKNKKALIVKGMDQSWLHQFLWPIMKQDVLQHDNFNCKMFGEADTYAFPKEREGREFIGSPDGMLLVQNIHENPDCATRFNNVREHQSIREHSASSGQQSQQDTGIRLRHQPQKIDTDVSKRWVVVGLAFSADSDMKRDGYLHCLPIIVAGWKRLGWSVIVVGVGKQNSFLTSAKNQKDISLAIDPDTRFLYVPSLEAEAVTISQISRMFVAPQSWIKESDVLMTSDIDIFPISRYFDDYDFSDSVAVLNAGCCGSFYWKNKKGNKESVTMYPMSNIAASKKTWMKFMDLEDTFDLTLPVLQEWLSKNYDSIIPARKVQKGMNNHWFMDQRVVSIQLKKYEKDIKLMKLNRQIMKDRVDRGFPHTFPSRFSDDELKGKRDMHMFHDIWQGRSGKYWKETLHIVSRFFDAHIQNLLLSVHM